MKSEILHLLRHADGYVSGQQLCETFGVSRTAVWKVINQLKEEGYVIDSVQNKGYRITEYPDIITASEIESLLLDDSGNMQGICRHIQYLTRRIQRITRQSLQQKRMHQTVHFSWRNVRLVDVEEEENMGIASRKRYMDESSFKTRY